MSDALVYADTIRSPDLRHEIPLPVPDPFLYVEHGGQRSVVCSAFEIPRIAAAAPEIEALAPEAFGFDELLADGMARDEAELECSVRACQRFGVTSAAVPPSFPLELADHLRANGVDVYVDRELFEEKRRRKNAAQVEGLRRAQRACEAALDVAREMLRRAHVAGSAAGQAGDARPEDRPADGGPGPNGVLTLDGEPLTSERIKAEIERVFSEHGVAAEEFIVSHGAQTAIGHDMGSGALLPNEPIVFDLFPRDRETGIYSDMTRTYVVGEVSDELREYWTLCKQALDETTAAAKPGVNGRALMELCCNLFHEHGHKTQLHKEPGEVLDSGFFHGLGHGVGLEVHEKPALSRSGDDLVPGDVITLEPGLYRAGYGGVRLEDILLVTDDGVEVITQYPYELEP